MKYLPLLFAVDGRKCLLVGGGRVATRRARTLARAGAVLDLVAVTAGEALCAQVQETGGVVHRRPWQNADITDAYTLVVAATDDPAVNRAIQTQCRALGIPVNVATCAAQCDIAFPNTIRRGPITVAIASGSSPLVGKLLRPRIEAMIPSGYAKLATLVEKYRDRVKAVFQYPDQRKAFWEKILFGAAAEQVFCGNPERAERIINEHLENPATVAQSGEVYLIGAGPGDPELLTLKAFRLLRQAEVVLYDRLVSERILEQIPAAAEMLYVGKKRSDHSVPQHNINQLLVEHARRGRKVARLKGGDPFIFGRGGEEIALLAEHRIPFQVVPGITAASGCACYAGIPLTHRDHAQSVRFVTGQLQDGTVDLPWEQLVAPGQTVVIYMGLSGLPTISDNLIAHGMDPATPAALVEQGTTTAQRVLSHTIATLPEFVRQQGVKAPTLLIIGSVVNLRPTLNWFNRDQTPPA